MIFRLLRAIYWVLANQRRPLIWKVVDTVFLTGLIVLVVYALLDGWDGLAYYVFLLPWVVILTQRSWYDSPKLTHRSRRWDRSGATRPAISDDGPEARHLTWDPLEDFELGTEATSGMSGGGPQRPS